MMTRILKIVLPLVVIVASMAVALALMNAKVEPKPRPAEDRRPLVEAVTVAKESVRLDVSVYGTVRPRTEIAVVPQVSGRVEHVSPHLREGAFFSKDEVLVRVDPRDYELAVTQAKAVVAQAKARLDREEAEAAIAKKEWEQYGKGNANALVLREPQLAEAKALLASAEAQLAYARLNLERTEIKAPYDGRVRTRSVDVGQFVTVGSRIATVFATDYAEVRIAIPDDQIAFLDLPLRRSVGEPGNGSEKTVPVRLTSVFGGIETEWQGSIVRTAAELDPKTRVVYTVARVSDPYGRERAVTVPLMVGSYVRAFIPGRTADDVVVVPRAALVGRDRVLLVDDEDRLRFRDVVVLRRESDRVLVTKGIEAGERVCITAVERPVDGMSVRVKAGESER